MKRLFILTWTELKLSIRNFDAVFFGIVMPLIIITVIYFIDKSIITTNFGAYISIGICAIGLMGLPITLSDYREKKILKRLQVTPITPRTLLSIQVLVQSIMAISSALLTTVAGILFFKANVLSNVFPTIVAYLIVLISIFSIGLLITSISPNVKKAGFICSLVYFPMLLFSGTTIPLSVFPVAVQKISMVLPLTQGVVLLNGVIDGTSIFNFPVQLTILVLVSIISILTSIRLFKWS
ncbi:MAG: ABC transporter permease [Spirochaetaceae bacterium]